MSNTGKRRRALVAWLTALAVGTWPAACSPPTPLVLEPLAPGVSTTARSPAGRARPGVAPSLSRASVVVRDGVAHGAAEADRAARRSRAAAEAQRARTATTRPATTRPSDSRVASRVPDVAAAAVAAGAAAVLVDLNLATRAELESLPGIGPAMAERIERERPYATVAALERVRGIGPRTMELLRPLVTVSATASP